MPGQDPLGYLKALLSKDFESEKYQSAKTKPHHESPPLVITVSRDYGALGEEAVQELSLCLQLPVYDKEILERIAKITKTDKYFVEKHDEQSQAGISGFLYSLITGTTATLDSYRRALFDVVLELSRHDSILVGRGAHLVLKDKNVFRLRIVGSKGVCAKRVAEAEGLSLADAEAKVTEVNNHRHKSINTLFENHFPGSSLEHAVNFDLIINTDGLTAQGAALITAMALEQAGYDLKRAAKP